MKLRLGVVLFAVCITGCDRRDKPAVPVEADDPVEAADTIERTPAVLDHPVELPPTEGDTPKAMSDSPQAEAAASPPSSPRDLAAELRAAVESPTDCLKDFRPSSARTIVVRISAVVRPTGMIIEPSASATGLSANDRRCIERRVEAVTLAPLGATSSRPVSSTIEIQYEPPEVETDLVAPPPPKPDDVVEPLPKKDPIESEGTPIQGPEGIPVQGEKAVPIQGPSGVPIEGPKPVPIERN